LTTLYCLIKVIYVFQYLALDGGLIMIEHSLDKKEITSSELTDYSISSITKKNWKTPKLLDMDYSETNSGGAGNEDGPGFS
jgi:ssDNA-specific exonuclease RecJ